ncbi:hypothetical protein [Photobacterium chitinilyticum]|uniref:Uncharacterized protein n=1 Tax=Photobacterium chitinilyticum TaxID=2485123 RepID=A0A444JVF5_9GAMM|nr:hypothetical protein [Photobacterium chitinilyticum]RWX57059.1 hypothetical protein EDI28_03190 [Photobacterium chitinilyticum]
MKRLKDPQHSSHQKVVATQEVLQIVEDGQRLLHFVARHGHQRLDSDAAQIIIDAQDKIARGDWSVEDEVALLVSFDCLATHVYPVTVESIKAVVPRADQTKCNKTQAEKVVAWYRRYTVATLIFLLLFQVYYLFGHDIKHNLTTAFEARTQAQLALEQATDTSERKKQLEFEQIDQRLDANYRLLQQWNRIWSLGGTLSIDLPEQKLHQFRIAFFAHVLAAEAVLTMLQNYLLPLLYGLLGAFIFVLRNLLQQIKSLTYTNAREVGFRLRLTLGSLAGMITGWLFKPDAAMEVITLSPMAIAFVAGYSIELLFALLDRIIDSVKRSLPKGERSGTNPSQ